MCSSDLQNVVATNVLYAQGNTIKALAQAAMVSMAEADVEMVLDMSNEYPTKADIERVFQGLHDQATDLINDMIEDLRDRLLTELAQKRYTARVTALTYDDEGQLDDIGLKNDFDVVDNGPY